MTGTSQNRTYDDDGHSQGELATYTWIPQGTSQNACMMIKEITKPTRNIDMEASRHITERTHDDEGNSLGL